MQKNTIVVQERTRDSKSAVEINEDIGIFDLLIVKIVVVVVVIVNANSVSRYKGRGKNYLCPKTSLSSLLLWSW